MVEGLAGDLVRSKAADAGSHDEHLINKLAMEMVSTKDALAPAAAPQSLLGRYGAVTLKGIGNVPAGMLHAVEDDIKHPMQTLEMVGGAAAMGFALKTVLPEAGPAGKIAGAAIGAYFTYKAAEPIMHAYKLAGTAKTMNDIDVAAMHLGDAGGSFIVNSAVAAAGYKLGSAGAERVLLSEKMDGFADVKQAFWDGVSDKASKLTNRFTDAVGITATAEPVKTSAAFNLESRHGDVQRFAPSDRARPNGVITGEVASESPMDVTIQLKSKASDLAMDRALKRMSLGRQAPLSETEFAEKFGASQDSLDQVTKFANDNGLKVTEADLRSGRVVVSGTAGKFENAFQTKINTYDINGVTVRGREGALMIPNTMADHIEGVFGMDDRPQARSYAVKLAQIAGADLPKLKAEGPVPSEPVPKPTGDAGPKPPAPTAGDGPGRGPVAPNKSTGYMPNEVADAYNFPKDTTGKGQGVAIIELGGGIDMQNEAAYYKAHGLKMPEIKVITVDGAKNAPGDPSGADGEVALDSQVIGAVAPDAKQAVIFAPNSDRGFMDAITRAAFPEVGENPNQAISISWGGPIESWTDQGKRGMNLAFKKAALKGISVFAASGDDGAIDNSPSRTFQVDYPAADPYVTGTGGTRLTIKNGQIASEVAWNNGSGRGAGGGGISPDEVPDYQKDLKMPANANNTGVLGRGVPDVAGNADPVTGYRIRVGGSETIMGGTSAVSPLYAALAVRLNEGLGGSKPVGFMNPFFYKNGMAGTAPYFNDITSGNNNGYETAKGWDAVTGWGSLNGEKLLNAYKGDGATLSTPLATKLAAMVPQELKSFRDIVPIPMNVHVPSDRSKAG